MKFDLPTLKYNYDALEPHIDEETMNIHHTKHHQAYINKLKAAVEGTDLENKDLAEVLRDLEQVPEDIRTAVRNNGGGHYNHTLFWDIMTPNAKEAPEGELLSKINDAFGSFDKFKALFENAAKTRFGSGWAWLVVNRHGDLLVTSTPNQDVPFKEGTPILGLDVWEHAYYLNYQNRRPDYVSAFWNVVDWDKVAENFNNAR